MDLATQTYRAAKREGKTHMWIRIIKDPSVTQRFLEWARDMVSSGGDGPVEWCDDIAWETWDHYLTVMEAAPSSREEEGAISFYNFIRRKARCEH